MAHAIDVLRNEHANMAKLLSLLERQIDEVERSENPDYVLIKSITDYFADFPASCHHPKEDLIYDRLKQNNPDAAKVMGDLEAEHVSVLKRLDEFVQAVDNVLLEVEVSREDFCAVARQFLEEERKHMMMEERYFFPVALEMLSDSDWAEIDARLTRTADPLFDASVEDRFRTLRRELLEWGAS